MATTRIKAADWVVGWDGSRHVYLKNADVVFADDTIVAVGPGYTGPVDREVDGSGHMVIPGFVNLHSHPSSEPLNKGYMEEIGSPNLGMGGYYEYAGVIFRGDDEARRAAAEVAYCEQLKSGCTTVCDLSAPYPGWMELAERSRLRLWIAPMFRNGRPVTTDGKSLVYEWDRPAGEKAFRAALDLVDLAERHESPLLSGMVTPAQCDTSTEDLLQDAIAAARERGVRLQTHGAQNWAEFYEMVKRNGMTPVEFMAKVGLLHDKSIVGHAIFIDKHPRLQWWSENDLGLLASSGVTVAHCPTVYSRRTWVLHHFGRYLKAGVRMAMGTDTYPHNMVEELRWASILCKVAAGDVYAVQTGQLFHAATVGGADALGRPDLGRLAPGARADLVIVDMNHWAIRPGREPLRCLIFSAGERPIKHVFVNGRQVVDNGTVLTLDHDDALDRLAEGQRRMERDVPAHDWAKRTAEQASPMALPVVSAL